MAKPVSPREMFDLWQKMFAPASVPIQSLMFPDVNEVDKKIAELETVESWLKANLNMVQLSVKSLEYQRALLKGGEKAKAALSQGEPGASSAQWAWNLMKPPAARRKRGK